MCLQCKNKIARVSYELMLTKTMLKSDNLQYNMLGRWDERLIYQASDVPNIIFFKILCKIPLFIFL